MKNMLTVVIVGFALVVSRSAVAGDVLSLEPTPPEITADEYALDDGTGNATWGASGQTYFWLNQFTVIAGLPTITAVRIAWGASATGLNGEILIFDDPNNDGDPTDITPADLLASAPVVGGASSNTFLTYPVGNVLVGSTGDSFFVAVCLGPGGFPARLDNTDPDQARSWSTFGDPTTFLCNDPNGTGSFPLEVRAFTGSILFDGDWMLRANATGGSVAVETGTWGSFKTTYK
jgi:hypothetical protein